MGRPRAGHARPLQGGGIVLKRLVGSGLDRSGKVAGDGNRTRRHIYIPHNYAAAAQLRGGVKTPPYSTDDLRQPIITPAAYSFLSIPTKYEQNKCPAAFWGQPGSFVHYWQHRTIPALRLKHRSGGSPRQEPPQAAVALRSASLRLGVRHGICVAKMLDKTSSIICAFGLAAAAPRSPYRHLELCGIAY